jgi:hypothetical protein
MLSPHRAPLKRGTKAGSLLVHQLTAPLPRSGFVLRPTPVSANLTESPHWGKLSQPMTVKVYAGETS